MPFQFGGQEFTEANALTIALASIAVIMAFYSVAKTCEKFFNNRRQKFEVTKLTESTTSNDSGSEVTSLGAGTGVARETGWGSLASGGGKATGNQDPLTKAAGAMGHFGFRNQREHLATGYLVPEGRNEVAGMRPSRRETYAAGFEGMNPESQGDNLTAADRKMNPSALGTGPDGRLFRPEGASDNHLIQTATDNYLVQTYRVQLPDGSWAEQMGQEDPNCKNNVNTNAEGGVFLHKNPFSGCSGGGGNITGFRNLRERFAEFLGDNKPEVTVAAPPAKVTSTIAGVPASKPSPIRYLRLVPLSAEQALASELPWAGTNEEGQALLDSTTAFSRDLSQQLLTYGPDEITEDNVVLVGDDGFIVRELRNKRQVKLTDGVNDYYLNTLNDWKNFKYDLEDTTKESFAEALMDNFIPNARRQTKMAFQVPNDLARSVNVTSGRSRSGRSNH